MAHRCMPTRGPYHGLAPGTRRGAALPCSRARAAAVRLTPAQDAFGVLPLASALARQHGLAAMHAAPDSNWAGHGSGRRRAPVNTVTLDEWADSVKRACDKQSASPRDLQRCLKSLLRVPVPHVAQGRERVEVLLTRAIDGVLSSNDKLLALKLHAVGAAVDRHRCLRGADAAGGSLGAALRRLMHSAAEDPDTYVDARSAAQMATAQLSLGMYSDTFWQELARADLRAFGGRELSTLLHRSVKCALDVGAPLPSDRLWQALMLAVEGAADQGRLNAQEVSNCLWACARDSSADTRSAEAASAQQRCVCALVQAAASMAAWLNPQSTANVWWALSVLNHPPDAKQRRALLYGVHHSSPRMNAQEVSNTLLALARLRVPVQGATDRALLTAAETLAAEMSGQHVSNSWWALAETGTRPTAGLAGQLMAATERTAPQMTGQDVGIALWGMGKLRMDVPSPLQAEMWTALQRTAPSMTSQSVNNVSLGVAKLRLAMPDAAQAAWYAAVQRTASAMNAQDASNIVWALAEMRDGDVPEHVRACILGAVERTASRGVLAGVDQVLSGLAVLQWRTEPPLQYAWLASVRRLAPAMNAEHIQRFVEALGALRWRLDEETHVTLLQAADRLAVSGEERRVMRSTLQPLLGLPQDCTHTPAQGRIGTPGRPACEARSWSWCRSSECS